MPTLSQYVELSGYNTEAISNKLLELKVNEYCRFKIIHFKKLMVYEKQAKENFIAVEREKDNSFVVYDNTHFREKHEIPFSNMNSVARYVSHLLTETTLLGYTQLRAVTERGLQFGDKIEVKMEDGKSQKGVLISACDMCSQEDMDKSDFMLHYRPLKKDGTLSKAIPRKLYNYKCEKSEE